MRKPASSALIAAVALVAAFAPGVSRADFIYDNTTTTFTGNRSFTGLQSGDEVNAGGTDRVVTRLEIGLDSQGQAATLSTFQAFLYANDGAGGAPGTLLWESALMQSVALTGGNDLFAFAVPDVLVPDTFTWAAQTGAATPVAAGLPIFGAPTVGSEVINWFGGPGSWTSGQGLSAIYEARITATGVPAPSTLTMAGVLGVMGLVGAWARRKRLAA